MEWKLKRARVRDEWRKMGERGKDGRAGDGLRTAYITQRGKMTWHIAQTYMGLQCVRKNTHH